jgi:uncharacterized DUF497 family protein
MCYNIDARMKISGLAWDDVNLEHIISKHGISPGEVEDVCFGPHYACPAKFNRKAIYGQAVSGKYLMVILELLYDSIFRPVTARGMKQNERRKYRIIMGEGK